MRPTHTTVHLQPGQNVSVYAETGQLVVQHGCVTVTSAPQWLAGTMWSSQVVIPAGLAHAVDSAGWIGLRTDIASAELLCVQAAHRARAPLTQIHLIHMLRALARRAFA
jgi:hypothetical protein